MSTLKFESTTLNHIYSFPPPKPYYFLFFSFAFASPFHTLVPSHCPTAKGPSLIPASPPPQGTVTSPDVPSTSASPESLILEIYSKTYLLLSILILTNLVPITITSHFHDQRSLLPSLPPFSLCFTIHSQNTQWDFFFF